MKVVAAVAKGIGQDFDIENIDLEPPRAGEVLVKIVAAGVCHTDIAMRDHKIYPIPHPVVLGHEGAGIVQAVGSSVTKVVPGDHVALTFGSCGYCLPCRNHVPSYCEFFDEFNFHGARCDHSTPLSYKGSAVHTFMGQSSFATHAVIAERSVVKVRRDVPLELVGPMGCAVQTGAGGVLNSLNVRPNDSIAIFGTGSVGLCALMGARIASAGTIIAVDIVDSRLGLARSIGATHVINPKREDALARISEITDGRGVNFTFDTTANMTVLKSGIMALARNGVCGFVGGAPKGMELTIDIEHMMTGGRTLRGIILGDCDPDLFIPKMVDLYAKGQFPIDRIVTTYPLERVNDAVHDSELGKTIKAVLTMN